MNKIIDDNRSELFSLQDKKYRDFQVKLIPTVDPDNVIGVRTPEIRKLAKKLIRREDADEFLRNLPHQYFDEDQVHALAISEIKDYKRCIEEIDRFLPFVNNWATCDQMSPKVFRKHRTELLGKIRKWINSEHIYTVRFAIGMLMHHFLDEDFDPAYPKMVAAVRSGEYYINMMIAWYFATALAKQESEILPYLQEQRLPVWVHNKTIQKSVESYRIAPELKEYLRSLRIKK